MSVFDEFRLGNGEDGEWYEVSKSHPCPICGKPDWCSATGPEGDPNAVVCMRVESNNQRPNGGWLHRLRANATRGPSKPRQSSGNPASAATMPTIPKPKRREPPPFEQTIVIDEVGKDHKHSGFWVYHDADGNEIGAAVRYDDPDGGKRVLPVSVNDKSRWVKKAMPEPRPLYDLHILSKLEAGSHVFVVEGEKCAEAVKSLGLVATTSSGGGKATAKTDWSPLAGMDVVVLRDNDEPGEAFRQDLLRLLQQLENPPAIRCLDLPGLPEKGDVVDWLAAGGTKEQLLALVAATEPWKPESEPWPEIQPFESEPLPEFPVDALPSPLREWVEAESIATQTPPDLAALLGLAVCASAIARNIVVEPRPGWTEPTNIYTAIVLEPANRKSAVFADATKPLREVEKEEAEAAREKVAIERTERRQAELRLKNLERSLAKKHSSTIVEEAEELARKLEQWPDPALPRRIVDDATNEKLGIMLAEQNGRIASMSPEGGVFDLMAGQYSKSGMPSFGVYLMGHSGDDLRTDRVTRQAVYVERPALTIAYAIQKAVIEGLADKPSFRGRGLLARFWYAAPESWIGRRDVDPPCVPTEVIESYRQLVRRLCKLELEGSLSLDLNAYAAFTIWQQEIEDMLGDGGKLDIIQDWGGKLAGQTLRLAGIMHCIRHYDGNPLQHDIDAETIWAAINVASYLIPHADYVLTSMCSGDESNGPDAAELAELLLKWIARKKRDRFTKRDAHQENSKLKRKKVEELDPVLTELVARGYLREVPIKPGGRGRPPSPEYEVNPSFWDIPLPETYPQKPQKCPQASSKANSEDSETQVQVTDKNNALAGEPLERGDRVRFEA